MRHPSKALVTGADGFLGREVVRQLAAAGYDVIPVSRRAGAASPAVVCDLADPLAVARLVDDREPDVVINLAAVIAFDAGVLASLIPVNTIAPGVLASRCAAGGARLVQASSIAIHAADVERFDVDTPAAPATDYGRSKHYAEQLVAASGCRSAIVRFGGIFGHPGPAHLGLNRSIAGAKAGTRPTLTGSGAAKRNYVSVHEAAADVVKCVTDSIEGVVCSGGEVVSIAGMLESVCRAWLPGLEPDRQPGPDGRDQILVRSGRLGPSRSFDEALRGL